MFGSYRFSARNRQDGSAKAAPQTLRATPTVTFDPLPDGLLTAAAIPRDAVKPAVEDDQGPQSVQSPPPNAIVPPSYIIRAEKNGETNEIQQISPTLTVAKARGLSQSGWMVHVVDSSGRHYAPSEFDEILKFDRR
jgi:hypothetical protein